MLHKLLAEKECLDSIRKATGFLFTDWISLGKMGKDRLPELYKPIPRSCGLYMIAYRRYEIIYIVYGGECEETKQGGLQFRIRKHFYLSLNENKGKESGPLRAWKHMNDSDIEILVSVFECTDDIKTKEKHLLDCVDFPANITNNGGLRLHSLVAAPPDPCAIPMPPEEWILPKNVVTDNFTVDELLLMF